MGRPPLPLLLAVSLAVFGAAGCVSTGTLGLAATSTAAPGELLAKPHAYRDLGEAHGQACRYFVLAVIPFGNSTFSTAMKNALTESGGDALLNVSTSSSLYGFIPIYNLLSFTCTTVQGTAIKILPSRNDSEAEPPSAQGADGAPRR